MNRGRSSPTPEGEQERPRFRTSLRDAVRSLPGGWVLPLLTAALLVLAGVRAFIVEPYLVPSGSMERTLRVGDRMLVDKTAYLFGSPSRGDVVVYQAPHGRNVVKRVIGVGGDRVSCCDKRGRVTVNGRALRERSYLYPGDAPSSVRFHVRVPNGRLWVLGDHRSRSRDSRAHLGDPGGGMVPVDDVVGKARWVVYPLHRLGVV